MGQAVALTEGKLYTNDELAVWFGISHNGFRNNKPRKLEELKQFAEYELRTNGRVYITKVIRPYYTKHNLKYKREKQNLIAKIIRDNPYQTYAHLAVQLKKRQPERFSEPLPVLVEDVRLHLIDMFGDEGEYGSIGEIVWCQDTKRGFDPINKEQLRFLRNTMIDEYSKSGLDLGICSNQVAFNEIGRSDYEKNVLDIIDQRYKKIIQRFKDRFGFTPVAATKYNLNTVRMKNGKRKIVKIKKK